MTWRQQLRQDWSRRRLTGARVREGRALFIRPLLDSGVAPSPPLGPRQRLRRVMVEGILREVDAGLLLDPVASPRFRADVRRLMEKVLGEAGMTHLGPSERIQLEDELAAELHGLGPLEGLVRDHTVSDILVNGPYDVWVDRHGRLERTDVRFDDEAHLLRLLARLTAAHGRHIEEATPYVDVRLGDGSRLHAMIPPLTAGGPALAIRRARTTPLRLEHLYGAGALSPEMGAFLGAAVEAGLNILISGGAAAGKTTLLNILAQRIPPTQRVVTIEETAELRIVHPHVVSLETRLPNVEGRGEVTMRTLVRNALRMRADRIIVGEVRGAEVFEMLQAMNVGHSGSLTTVHANNADDALLRLEMLALTGSAELPSRVIRELLGSAFHIAVHMTRLASGARRVVSIGEIARENGTVLSRDLFRLEAGPSAVGVHAATGVQPAFIERLRAVRADIERLLAPPGAAGRAGAP